MPNTPSTPAPADGVGFEATTSSASLEQLRQENASLLGKLEESEAKKALLKTALAELNNVTTKCAKTGSSFVSKGGWDGFGWLFISRNEVTVVPRISPTSRTPSPQVDVGSPFQHRPGVQVPFCSTCCFPLSLRIHFRAPYLHGTKERGLSGYSEDLAESCP